MRASAETLGPAGARTLHAAGADEVLMPCIGQLEEAASRARRVASGPVTLHVPANRVGRPEDALALLQHHGIDSALVVSGNPGHGRGDLTIYELIPYLRDHGIHVSVGAYPENYFATTSVAHRARSAGIVVDKQAAGAQRIITQASFSRENMRLWLEVVRSRGVTLPIHVGVMAPVPRRALAAVLRSARAEIFSHPRLQALRRENLDLLLRMLRSRIPDPVRFIREVGSLPEMRAEDGFHVFTHGADVRELIAAIHGVGRQRGLRAPAPGLEA